MGHKSELEGTLRDQVRDHKSPIDNIFRKATKNFCSFSSLAIIQLVVLRSHSRIP